MLAVPVPFVEAQPTTAQPATSQPATSQPTTSQPTTSQPTTSQPTTSQPVPSAPDLISPSFVVPEEAVERSPAILKFQARVSQARLPLGEAEFAQVEVHLLRSGSRICTERFSGVRIHDGVLNLDVGRAMNCNLQDALRTSAELLFEVCLGSSGCLKPVELGTVPFAAKSNYAHHAEEAHRSNVAVQCNYAHRVTADADLYVTKRVGKGYYEFHTPTRLDGLALNPQTQRGGFIQWTPVAADQDVLHLCARDGSTGSLRRLSRLLLHAEQSDVAGGLAVGGATTLSGLLTVVQDASLSANLQVAGNTTLAGGLSVAGPASLGPVRVGALPTDAPTAELFVRGNAEFVGDPSSRVVFQNDVEFRGNVALPAVNVVASDSVSSAAIVDGSIGAADLGPGSVTSAALGPNAVLGAAIVDGAITSRHLGPDAVTNAALAPNAVSSAEILDRSVTNADLAPSAVTGDKIANFSIGTNDIAGSAITGPKIALDAVGPRELANGSVGSGNILNGAIQPSHLSDSFIRPSGDYTVSRNNVAGISRVPMSYVGRSFCFLTEVRVEDTDAVGELAGCRIEIRTVTFGSRLVNQWFLAAQLGTTQDADAWCTARCMVW